MDAKRALGSPHFNLCYYDGVAWLNIFNSMEDHHVLSPYPYVPPKPPFRFPFFRNLPATNHLQSPCNCPYCHQGMGKLHFPVVGFAYSNCVWSGLIKTIHA